MQRYRDKKIRVCDQNSIPFAKNCKVNKENVLKDLRKMGEGGKECFVLEKKA